VKVVIRADSGPTVGVGHAMRSGVLGAALRRRGHTVTAVLGEVPMFVTVRYEASDIPIVDIAGSGVDVVLGLQPDVVIVDGYRLDAEAAALDARDLPLVMIDDNNELPVELASVVVNQNLHATGVEYPPAHRPDRRLLLGSEFALIRADVLAVERSGGSGVLVAMGGTDPQRLTLPIVAGLLASTDVAVQAVLGADHPDHADLAAMVGDRFRFADSDLVDAMSSARLAVIGGGSTLWEVAVLGIPSVAAIVADNQEDGSRAAERAGFVSVVDARHRTTAADEIVATAAPILSDPARCDSMARAGRSMFDGRGVERVATAVERLGTSSAT